MVIYVTRRSSKEGHSESSPCLDCFHTIERLGIKKMVYTTRSGGVESCKPCQYFGGKLTRVRRNMI
jgi:hypothetical protein